MSETEQETAPVIEAPDERDAEPVDSSLEPRVTKVGLEKNIRSVWQRLRSRFDPNRQR